MGLTGGVCKIIGASREEVIAVRGLVGSILRAKRKIAGILWRLE